MRQTQIPFKPKRDTSVIPTKSEDKSVKRFTTHSPPRSPFHFLPTLSLDLAHTPFCITKASSASLKTTIFTYLINVFNQSFIVTHLFNKNPHYFSADLE
ncbi:hypothetical protein L6452_34287 [Arctium lappa]|uniref:Uncharacterized protein n=1 Tax=Arctium lappa TaxID=4217 RepID=A0ACB8YIC5_ARCLA|nr:hypothetical protein L6452_34287 [Arctium lappa]